VVTSTIGVAIKFRWKGESTPCNPFLGATLGVFLAFLWNLNIKCYYFHWNIKKGSHTCNANRASVFKMQKNTSKS
jgi:hypothetical protein